MVQPTESSLYSLLTRLAKVRGGSASVDASASLESLVAAIEKEADLIVARGGAATGGAFEQQLASLVTRVENALRAQLNKDVGQTTGTSAEALTSRLESLVGMLPSSSSSSSAPVQLAPTPFAMPAVAAPAPAPAAAKPTPATTIPAAAPTPVADDSAAKAAAAKKAADEEAAKQKAAADAAVAKKAAEEEAARKAAADAEAAKKAEADRKAAADAEAKKAEAAAAAKLTPAPAAAAPAAAAASAPAAAAAPASNGQRYTYEQLKTPAAVIPGVDWATREQCLSDDEFQTVFKMSKAEFNGLASWKRAEKKKAVGLF